MQYWIGFGVPILILLIVLVYGGWRSGWLTAHEERQLDADTRATQQREDPQRSIGPMATNRHAREGGTGYAAGTRRMLAVAVVIAAVLLVGGVLWPLMTQNQIGTPKGGANPQTAPDTTATRGAPAQQAAESTVGRTNPAGQDTNNARQKNIKQSSHALQLSSEQRQQLKDVIARQSDAPKIQKAPFEPMIGAAVPRQVDLKDLPPEITEILQGYWGDQYVLVQDQMVIVDQHSRRVVAIVPAVA
jgi:hypothetical protein